MKRNETEKKQKRALEILIGVEDFISLIWKN